MGTSNFYSKNATHIFRVEIADEWSYNDLESALGHSLSETFAGDWQKYDTAKWVNTLRSYGRKEIGRVFGVIEIETGKHRLSSWFSLCPQIVNGYYADVNLDWEIKECQLEILTDDPDEDDYLYEDDSWDDADWSNVVPHHPYFEDLFIRWRDKNEKLIETKVEQLENVFKSLSTPLYVSASFSNGETWYKAVED